MTRSTYNVRQSQPKILDIQNNWNHDGKPLDQSCLYHSLCATLFFFFSTDTLFFFCRFFFVFFFSLQFHILGNMTIDKFYFCIVWLTQYFISSCVKKKKGRKLARCSALDESSQMQCEAVEVTLWLGVEFMWLRGRTCNPRGDHKRVDFLFSNYSMLSKMWSSVLINTMTLNYNNDL